MMNMKDFFFVLKGALVFLFFNVICLNSMDLLSEACYGGNFVKNNFFSIFGLLMISPVFFMGYKYFTDEKVKELLIDVASILWFFFIFCFIFSLFLGFFLDYLGESFKCSFEFWLVFVMVVVSFFVVLFLFSFNLISKSLLSYNMLYFLFSLFLVVSVVVSDNLKEFFFGFVFMDFLVFLFLSHSFGGKSTLFMKWCFSVIFFSSLLFYIQNIFMSESFESLSLYLSPFLEKLLGHTLPLDYFFLVVSGFFLLGFQFFLPRAVLNGQSFNFFLIFFLYIFFCVMFLLKLGMPLCHMSFFFFYLSVTCSIFSVFFVNNNYKSLFLYMLFSLNFSMFLCWFAVFVNLEAWMLYSFFLFLSSCAIFFCMFFAKSNKFKKLHFTVSVSFSLILFLMKLAITFFLFSGGISLDNGGSHLMFSLLGQLLDTFLYLSLMMISLSVSKSLKVNHVLLKVIMGGVLFLVLGVILEAVWYEEVPMVPFMLSISLPLFYYLFQILLSLFFKLSQEEKEEGGGVLSVLWPLVNKTFVIMAIFSLFIFYFIFLMHS